MVSDTKYIKEIADLGEINRNLVAAGLEVTATYGPGNNCGCAAGWTCPWCNLRKAIKAAQQHGGSE